jgi:hypothetical protein
MESLFYAMLRYRFFVSALVLIQGFLLFHPGAALAEQKPNEVLKELLDKIKSQSNASAVVDYVDWQEAFNKASEEQKKNMNVTGPEQMKQFYRQILESPAVNFRKQVEERLASVPAEQKPMMEQQLKRMEEVMRKKEEEMKEKIAGTTYEIGEAKIEGNAAKVKLTQTYKGETKEEDVQFVKSGERWLLPSVAVMANDSKPKDGGVTAR